MNKKSWSFLVILVLVLAACGDSGNNNNASGEEANNSSSAQSESGNNDSNNSSNEKTDSNGEQLYHEIGESFEFESDYSGSTVEITVEDIWMEDGSKHADYIEKYVGSPEDNATVTFITFKAKNKSDDTIIAHDFIPKYARGANDIDLAYPESDEIEEDYRYPDIEIEPGETKEFTGAATSTTYDEVTGAFFWKMSVAELSEVVFQTPPSERRDRMGIYDLNEEIYVIDNSDDHRLIVTINDISVEEETEFETDEGKSWLVMDMNIENAGEEYKVVSDVFPSFFEDGEEIMSSSEFIKDGEALDDPYNGSEVVIDAGETVDGVYYAQIDEDITDRVQIVYEDPSFLKQPEFGQKINFNID